MKLNKQRALRARRATAEYKDGDMETKLFDLLTDIQHLCDQADLNFEDVLRTARFHYQHERIEK